MERKELAKRLENILKAQTNLTKRYEQKEYAVEAPESFVGKTIEDAVSYLEKCRAEGKNIYVDCNGRKLYSYDVTMDSAYLQVTGMTKEYFDKVQRAWQERDIATLETLYSVIETIPNREVKESEIGQVEQSSDIGEKMILQANLKMKLKPQKKCWQK